MKRISFILLVAIPVLIFQSCCMVQSYTGAVFAGFGKSSIHGQDSSWTDPLGGHVGIQFVPTKNIHKLSVNPGIAITLQGSKYEEPAVSGKVKFVYLHAPILGRYRFEKGFFAEAGIQPGILLSAKDIYDGSSHDFKDDTKSFEFGIPVGIGYETKNGFEFGLRYIQGTSNINKTGPKDHNLLAIFRVAYRLEKKRKN